MPTGKIDREILSSLVSIQFMIHITAKAETVWAICKDERRKSGICEVKNDRYHRLSELKKLREN